MLSYRAVNLQGAGFCLDIVKGLHEPAAVRGTDFTVPGKQGQFAGNRKKHVREVILEGYISGVGNSLAERQEDFHAKTATIMAAMDRTLTEGALVVTGGDYGLPDDETWTLQARCADAIGGPMLGRWTAQEWSIKLFAVEDTEWDVSSV